VVDWYGVADPDALHRMSAPDGAPPAQWDHPPDVLLAGADPATHAAAAPLRQVHPAAPPFLLVHGTDDRLVPFAQSEALRAALSAAGVPVELVPVVGADHIFAGCPDIDELVTRSVRFLAHTLTSS